MQGKPHPLSWNEQGPPGQDGADGINGVDGIDGVDGAQGQPGNLALAGQSCPDGQVVVGFDSSGDLTCAELGGPTPTPDPQPMPTPTPGPQVGDACDDGNPATINDTIIPGAICVGTLADADGDGFISSQFGGMDCDDSDAAVHPGATDVPGDGIDNNCDGVIDNG